MPNLAEFLLNENLITASQLNDAKTKQIGAKKPIQELLVEMGFISEENILAASSRFFKLPIIDISQEKIDPAATKLLPYAIARRHGVFPLRKENDNLALAISDPQDVLAIDDIKMAVPAVKLQLVFAARSQITKLIDTHYNSDDSVYDILKNFHESEQLQLIQDSVPEDYSDVSVKYENSPAIRLANIILSDAIKARASDIHIEPKEKISIIRYRVDGDLRNILEIPINFHLSLSARIKILAHLDIAESRKPQDGRIKVTLGNRQIDLRVSILPAFYGESIAIRILDPQEARKPLDQIGLSTREVQMLKETLKKPQGMNLVTGPTGSGKTTTIYAALNFVKTEAKNIITIEDPIEYLIDGVNQMQVNLAKDVTFANGLRNILRQDPNVIMVGEIRDRDTADIAFRSALTGHQVFSTVHTNSAIATVTRLLDIGLQPYIIASSLNIIIAQRLIRIICPHCKTEDAPLADIKEKLMPYIQELNITKFYRGKGCEKCAFSGYLGRTGIFELVIINDRLKQLISQKVNEDSLFQEAKNSGMVPLLKSGMQKVADGVTTLEEVIKVVGISQEEQLSQKSKKTGQVFKILIADDEEDILQVLQRRLLAAGYEVDMARDGGELVELAYKQKPDLIISDVTMPKVNGFEAVKKLRSSLQTASVPVIILTARQDKESEIAGLDFGADDYITKPFDADKILARVKMLLRRKEA
ncbi:MAG: Flp pilus assembly complex ATPase component TadA [Candidatus Omnitrophica bacterium]|jgi:type IV pilus assembly protein PilB|nr:Flp pilus assembly complex ATPase component TadA [Candidatus Omnitrophota bacterium]